MIVRSLSELSFWHLYSFLHDKIALRYKRQS